jgi:PPOX class probable F420-dependent enzyme
LVSHDRRQQNPAMTEAEPALPGSHADLLDGEHTAVLTTIGPDGRPQSTALFFLVTDGRITMSVRGASQKRRNLAARPACTFVIVDPENTQRYVEVRADAELAPDPDYVVRDAVVAKYHLPTLQEPPGTERVAITLRPVRVRAQQRPSLRRNP